MYNLCKLVFIFSVKMLAIRRRISMNFQRKYKCTNANNIKVILHNMSNLPAFSNLLI